MQSTNLPSKFLVPFAANDSAKVELPVTTSTVGRASQSAGFPPITGQPPETGGQPPQLEDFNGGMNQIARVTWWAQLGGMWRYDSTFATDTNIGGYPLGSVLQSAADKTVAWISTVENNTADPDVAGTGWAPWGSYAPASIATAGGTSTPTLAVAGHATLVITGTLSSAAIIILPTWQREWTITNSTTGAFTTTVKTAAGSGVVIPQNGAPTHVIGNGTSITQVASNIAAATTATQAMQLGQATGRLLRVAQFSATGAYTPSAGTNSVLVVLIGGGGGGGGCGPTAAGQASGGAAGSGGGFAQKYMTSGFTGITITIGGGGTPGDATGSSGGSGGNTTFGGVFGAGGGAGGAGGTGTTTFPASIGTNPPGTGFGAADVIGTGEWGQPTLLFSSANPFQATGSGGGSWLGGGARVATNTAATSGTVGGGGSGPARSASFPGIAGGSGGPGLAIIYEYS